MTASERRAWLRLQAIAWGAAHDLTEPQTMALLAGLAQLWIKIHVPESGVAGLALEGGGRGLAMLRGWISANWDRDTLSGRAQRCRDLLAAGWHAEQTRIRALIDENPIVRYVEMVADCLGGW